LRDESPWNNVHPSARGARNPHADNCLPFSRCPAAPSVRNRVCEGSSNLGFDAEWGALAAVMMLFLPPRAVNKKGPFRGQK
jgi:hypothetical protein